MGLLRSFFSLVGADRRVAVAGLMLLGAGLALLSGYYSHSGAPPEARGGPPPVAVDATGSLAVGSLHGEDAAAEEIERVAKKSSEPRSELPSGEDAGKDGGGTSGAGREVREPSPALEVSADKTPGEPSGGGSEDDGPEDGGGAPGGSGTPSSAPEPVGEEAAPEPVGEGAAPESTPESEWTVPPDKTLYLTIPAMSRVRETPAYDVPGDDERALAAGSIHLKGSGFPWDPEANVYIAGHRIGYSGTGSYYIFYDLDVLGDGDEIFVKDATGRSYTYRVYDTTTVSPDDLTVANPEPGKNIITLQTCTLPDYARRLLVHAEKV